MNSTADPFVDLVREGVRALTSGGAPGAFLVDLLPWSMYLSFLSVCASLNPPIHLVKYIPEWVPGAHFKTVARLGYKASHDMKDKPYEETRDKYVSRVAIFNRQLFLKFEIPVRWWSKAVHDHEDDRRSTGERRKTDRL